jgi:GTP-binding protein
VIVVANKLDNQQMEKKYSINALGFADTILISAVTGKRCADLLDKVVKRLPVYKKQLKEKVPVMTIIGRPNVGKSTLFNQLVGSDISIISDIPGTTRDSVQAVFKKDNREFIIFDTAGYRRRGKIKPGIERFSIYRALDAIARSSLVLVVVDGEEGITRQDVHLVQLALEQKKSVIVVVNKIDKVEGESTEKIANFYRYEFVLKQVIVGISALNKKNIHLLIREIKRKLLA